MSRDFGGWDPNDWATYWERRFAVEAAGNQGGDEAAEAKLREYGLRDWAHYQQVNDAFQEQFGGDPAFAQAGVDARMRGTKNAMNARMQGELKGDLAPFEGVSLEQWAFVMAKVAGGQPVEPWLAKAGWDQPKWDRASAEWNARMSRDATATIATAYGQAFMASGDGPFAAAGKQVAGAMLDAGNRGDHGGEPIPFEKWIEITEAQSAGAQQGMDAAAILKSYGLTPAQWGQIGGWWGQKLNANAMAMMGEYNRLAAKYKAQFARGFSADKISF